MNRDMAQVAVNRDGTEIIGENLVRAYYEGRYKSLVVEGDYFNMDDSRYTDYVTPWQNECGGWDNISIELPNGTIEKIIGRTLTFEDGPIEI